MNKFTYDPSGYTGFRPEYPDALFAFLKKIVSHDDVVLDCGAGSGQGTKGLSRYFNYVIASDLSFELLSKAPKLSNVSYIQALAEQLPIHSHSINLICVAQAIHWFSHDDFYKEVKRVLRPAGVIAAWAYNQANIDSTVDQIVNKVYLQVASAQNPSRERQYLYDHYQTMPFPFEHISVPEFKIEMKWNLLQWLGYMSTWPGILEYQKRFNVDLVAEIKGELALAWGDPYSQKLIVWPIYLLLGRMI